MTSTLVPTRSENRVILHPISWETYQNLLTDLGDGYHQRLAYSEGYLEIMTPLGEHEYNNRFLESLVYIITDELNLNIKKMGSLTLKKDILKKGVEPDSCYYLKNEPKVRNKQNIDLNVDPPPDLVLEIDVTSGSLNKLNIYAALGVEEIWRYDDKKLSILNLDKTSLTYQKSEHSLAFPWLDIGKIPQFIAASLTEGETATLKSFRAWIREQTIKRN